MTENTPQLLCTNCRQPVTEQMNICPYCGHALKAGMATGQSQAPQQPPPPQVIVVPSGQASPQPEPGQKEEKSTGMLLLTAVLRFAIGFAIVIGISFLARQFRDQLMPFTPFVGAQSAEAAGVAWNYVSEVYPEFTDAERTVSAVRVDGEPLYIVDFVMHTDTNSQALRIAVSRDLSDAFPLEYYNSDAQWSPDNE